MESCVFSSHFHLCHSQHSLVLSWIINFPGWTPCQFVYKTKGHYIHALYKRILEWGTLPQLTFPQVITSPCYDCKWFFKYSSSRHGMCILNISNILCTDTLLCQQCTHTLSTPVLHAYIYLMLSPDQLSSKSWNTFQVSCLERNLDLLVNVTSACCDNSRGLIGFLWSWKSSLGFLSD